MVGFPRSGTSILAEAISLHESLGWLPTYLNRLPWFPHLAALNRITFLPGFGHHLLGKKKQQPGIMPRVRRLMPYCGEVFGAWKFCLGEKIAMDYLIGRSADKEERDKTYRYMRTVLRSQGKKILFTKLTGPPRIQFLKSIFPNARFIHIVRDPRAVIASLMQVEFWRMQGGLYRPWWRNGLPDEYKKEWQLSEYKSVALAAVQWKHIIEIVKEESKTLTEETFIEIRYEDFIDQPQKKLQEVFSCFGLFNSQRALHYIHSRDKLRNMNLKYTDKLSPGIINEIIEITKEVANSKGYDFK